MKSYNRIIALLLVLIFGIVLIFSGCKKEDEPAPELPPESSFIMNFDDFSNPDDTLNNREITTYHNWGYAYVNVAVWNTLITVGLAIPVASFLESFHHEAIYHPNANNWTWTYNFWASLNLFKAELTGYLQADSVVWEMRITRQNHYTDFLWYHGKSSIDRSGGYWTLNEDPLNPSPLLQIDWFNHAIGTSDIKYTNIEPGGSENGGYIFYGTTLEEFERFYDIYNKGQDNLTEIEWSHINKNGRVKDPNKFGDQDWHCWDVTLEDIICP